ncbi:DUF2125 domain-containing protein [Oricola sp.]|uniref:DUF2125 domain-containing protein n=1 Tax=Oricola sp. TaxID=1979950 RepID=UPI0025D60589|nr:DUF2125 domain-containing protein [Oricola sp.]MCI5075168.1 DUF2125 domain-containing protein [Oricola sp.]
MADPKAKPAYNAGRRIRWLGMVIILVAIAYSAGWFWLAERVEAEAARMVETQRGRGTSIECADREVRGYPFRLEVHCTAFDLARPAQGLTIEAGGFRSAAQVYEPRRIYAELDAPVAVQGALAAPIRFDWSLARASATLSRPVPQRGSVAVEDIKVALGPMEQALSASHAEAHMRINGADLDLALRYEGLVIDSRLTDGRTLPVVAGDADLTIADGVALAARGTETLRGVSGEIRRLALLLTPEQGVVVSGPFDIGQDGRLNARFEAILVDPAGLSTALKPVFPEFSGQMQMVTALPSRPGPDGTPETSIPVTVRDGRIVLGFIPVGWAPTFD